MASSGASAEIPRKTQVSSSLGKLGIAEIYSDGLVGGLGGNYPQNPSIELVRGARNRRNLVGWMATGVVRADRIAENVICPMRCFHSH